MHRLPRIAVSTAALALLPACSSTRTSFDWDREFDFSTLSTWSWDPSGPGGEVSELGIRRIEGTIETVLRERGFRRDDDAPDFLVAWSVSRRDRIRATDWGGYRGPYRDRWTGYSDVRTVDVVEYEEGTLVVDVVDPSSDRLVWRGTGSRALEGSMTPERADAIVRDAVESILAGFPPKS